MRNKIIIGLLMLASILLSVSIVGLCTYETPSNRVARQLDLGQRYLAELDYEQAVVAFNKVIEIDPMNVEAYLGLAAAYEGMGDLEKVSEVLEQGFELTQSDEIKDMLEKYLSEMLAVGDMNDVETETFTEMVETESIVQTVEEVETETTETVTETTAVKDDEDSVEDVAEINWAKIYYDYLTQDAEGIGINGEYGSANWTIYGGYRWNLIYVDNDMIPEIYMEGSCYASGDVLLHISEGRVIREYFGISGGSYIPYSGWIKNDGGHMGYLWGTLYSLENSVFSERGNYEGAMLEDSEGLVIRDNKGWAIIDSDKAVYRVGENEVSEEQYNEYIRNCTGGMEFESCLSKNSMPKSCLDFLRGVMQ